LITEAAADGALWLVQTKARCCVFRSLALIYLVIKILKHKCFEEPCRLRLTYMNFISPNTAAQYNNTIEKVKSKDKIYKLYKKVVQN